MKYNDTMVQYNYASLIELKTLHEYNVCLQMIGNKKQNTTISWIFDANEIEFLANVVRLILRLAIYRRPIIPIIG